QTGNVLACWDFEDFADPMTNFEGSSDSGGTIARSDDGTNHVLFVHADASVTTAAVFVYKGFPLLATMAAYEVRFRLRVKHSAVDKAVLGAFVFDLVPAGVGDEFGVAAYGSGSWLDFGTTPPLVATESPLKWHDAIVTLQADNPGSPSATLVLDGT